MKSNFKWALLALIIVGLFFYFFGIIVFEFIFDDRPYLLPVFVIFQPFLALGLKYRLRNSEDKHNLLKVENWINLWWVCGLFSFASLENMEIYLNQKLETNIPIRNLVSLIYFSLFISVYFTWIILRKSNKASENIETVSPTLGELQMLAFNIIQKIIAGILIFLLIFPMPHWYLGVEKIVVLIILIQQFRVAFFSKNITQQIVCSGLIFLYFFGNVFEQFTWQIINVIVCLFILISSYFNFRELKTLNNNITKYYSN